MQVSSEHVKRFLLELIDQASYQGRALEFVLSVKQEVQAAEIHGAPAETQKAFDAAEDARDRATGASPPGIN